MENRFLLMFLLLLLLQGYELLVDGQSSNCGGPMHRNGGGSFTSHAGYDGRSEYPQSRCQWVLSAGGPNTHVALTFENFLLEGGDGCHFDSVEIFDGTSASLGGSATPFLGRFCGQKKPPRLVSSGRQMTVVFVADNSVSKPGFRARFETIRAEREDQKLAPVTITPPAPVTELPPAPVTELPPAPVTEAPPAPVTELPPAPVTEAPPAPVTELPSAPVTKLPPAPVTEAPPAPVTELPSASATKTPQPEACGTDAHKAKAVTVQIFASPKMIRTWRRAFPQEAQRGKEAAGEELMVKLNRIFSEEKLGYGNSVTYALAQNGVEILDQNIVSSVLEGDRDTTRTAQRFCKKLNKHKAGKKWDAAVIVIDTSERPEELTSGAAAAHAGICAANLNCALLIGSDGKSTLGLFDRLLAHEFGHLFGVQHACRRGEYYAECRQSLMDSPGTRSATWHPRSRLAFRDIFNNPREHRCLRYRRNQSFLLETPGNKAILDQVCFAAWGSDPESPFKADQERTGQSAQAMARQRGSFGEVYRTNPEWFKLENVCKGIPCLMEKGKKLKFFGLDSESLEGEPCAVGKTCRNQVCKEP